jgi:hypothetical protein
MSMPLMVWVSVPPRPIQKVCWCSFSLTRSGSGVYTLFGPDFFCPTTLWRRPAQASGADFADFQGAIPPE